MQQPLSDEYIGVTQAAATLGVSRVTLHRWVKQGVLRAYTLGPRRVLLRRTDLDALVRPAGVSQPPAIAVEPLTASQALQAQSALDRVRALRLLLAGRQGGL